MKKFVADYPRKPSLRRLPEIILGGIYGKFHDMFSRGISEGKFSKFLIECMQEFLKQSISDFYKESLKYFF